MDTLVLRSALPVRPVSLRLAQRLGPLVVVALAYYAGCLAGFALRFPSSGISFFWPPTAVLTTALLLTAPRSWPALLAAAFVAHAVAHAQDGVPIGAWPLQFFGNGSQALLGALVVRRYSGVTPLFGDLRRVMTFIAGVCLLAPAAASIVPAYVYVAMGWATDFGQAWQARVLTNAVAALTLVPSLVAFWQYLSGTCIPRRLTEYSLLLLGLTAVHLATLYLEQADVLGITVALSAPVPFLLWGTIRFGGPGLSVALLWTTLLTIWNVSAGQGPLAGGAAQVDTVLGVQLFIAATAMPMMLIAGLLEQNRAEHGALVDAVRQNAAILKALPDVMFLLTRDGRYLRYYARGRADLPAAPDSLMGMHIQDVLPPDLVDTFARALASASCVTPTIIEYTDVTDGEARRYEGRFIGVDDDRVLSVIRDITQRWQSENTLRETQQRYELATRAGEVGVWDFNVQTGEVCVEGRLEEVLGYRNREIGTSGADWDRLVSPADKDELNARMMALINGATTTYEAEFRMIHKDGSVRWVHSKGAVTDTVGGKPARVTGTYTDITERKESARALQEANDALLRLGRVAALGELSASIAHELHQPLTAISANANACLRWLDLGPVAQCRDALVDVVESSRRASHIVTRTQQMFTNQPPQKRPLDLNEPIRNIVEIAEAQVRWCDVTLEMTLDESLPLVLADAVQIQQVLLNLIMNGLDAMEGVAGPSRLLHISSRRRGPNAVVSVRDSGAGFAPKDARRLFEPFFTTKAGGTGMGLTISQSIIRKHGGSLWAVANADRGATFRFKIPVQ